MNKNETEWPLGSYLFEHLYHYIDEPRLNPQPELRNIQPCSAEPEFFVGGGTPWASGQSFAGDFCVLPFCHNVRIHRFARIPLWSPLPRT